MVLMMSEAAMAGQAELFPDLPAKSGEPSFMDRLKEVYRIVEEKGPLIPVTFAADVLGVSRGRIYQLIEAGTIEAVEVGRYSYVTGDSVKAYNDTERKAGRPFKVPSKKDLWRASKATAKEMVK